jgi:hypothetical protein
MKLLQILLDDSQNLFHGNPLAMKSVVRRVGKNPDYKVSFSPIRVM